MIEEAIKKLRDEMQKEGQEYINVIGEELIKVVNTSEEAAEKIMAQDKNIIGSLKEMGKVARGKAKNGCAVMSDEEGMEIVYKYFGIDLKAAAKEGASTKLKEPERLIEKEPIKEIPKESKEEFSVDLDDLF